MHRLLSCAMLLVTVSTPAFASSIDTTNGETVFDRSTHSAEFGNWRLDVGQTFTAPAGADVLTSLTIWAIGFESQPKWELLILDWDVDRPAGPILFSGSSDLSCPFYECGGPTFLPFTYAMNLPVIGGHAYVAIVD